MIVILTIVAPVFGLIAIGYFAARTRLLDETAGRGLTEFAFKLGIPALLCRTIATAKLSDLALLEVWAAFYGAAVMTWLTATALNAFALRRPAADGAPGGIEWYPVGRLVAWAAVASTSGRLYERYKSLAGG